MAPIFLLDKRMLVVETSPGFYVCFRCGIVVLQAVKKLLVVHYFGACLLPAFRCLSRKLYCHQILSGDIIVIQ